MVTPYFLLQVNDMNKGLKFNVGTEIVKSSWSQNQSLRETSSCHNHCKITIGYQGPLALMSGRQKFVTLLY